jgi:hypothetical protein
MAFVESLALRQTLEEFNRSLASRIECIPSD